MDIKIGLGLTIYWTLMILFLGVGGTLGSDTYGNPFQDGGYNTTADFNESGFSGSEIDSGGFFSGVIGIFTAMGRIIIYTAFGITDALTGLPQILFSAWQTLVTIITIMFVISAFWNG